jgi:hypothetical protein
MLPISITTLWLLFVTFKGAVTKAADLFRVKGTTEQEETARSAGRQAIATLAAAD